MEYANIPSSLASGLCAAEASTSDSKVNVSQNTFRSAGAAEEPPTDDTSTCSQFECFTDAEKTGILLCVFGSVALLSFLYWYLYCRPAQRRAWMIRRQGDEEAPRTRTNEYQLDPLSEWRSSFFESPTLYSRARRSRRTRSTDSTLERRVTRRQARHQSQNSRDTSETQVTISSHQSAHSQRVHVLRRTSATSTSVTGTISRELSPEPPTGPTHGASRSRRRKSQADLPRQSVHNPSNPSSTVPLADIMAPDALLPQQGSPTLPALYPPYVLPPPPGCTVQVTSQGRIIAVPSGNIYTTIARPNEQPVHAPFMGGNFVQPVAVGQGNIIPAPRPAIFAPPAPAYNTATEVLPQFNPQRQELQPVPEGLPQGPASDQGGQAGDRGDSHHRSQARRGRSHERSRSASLPSSPEGSTRRRSGVALVPPIQQADAEAPGPHPATQIEDPPDVQMSRSISSVGAPEAPSPLEAGHDHPPVARRHDSTQGRNRVALEPKQGVSPSTRTRKRARLEESPRSTTSSHGRVAILPRARQLSEPAFSPGSRPLPESPEPMARQQTTRAVSGTHLPDSDYERRRRRRRTPSSSLSRRPGAVLASHYRRHRAQTQESRANIDPYDGPHNSPVPGRGGNVSSVSSRSRQRVRRSGLTYPEATIGPEPPIPAVGNSRVQGQRVDRGQDVPASAVHELDGRPGPADSSELVLYIGPQAPPVVYAPDRNRQRLLRSLREREGEMEDYGYDLSSVGRSELQAHVYEWMNNQQTPTPSASGPPTEPASLIQEQGLVSQPVQHDAAARSSHHDNSPEENVQQQQTGNDGMLGLPTPGHETQGTEFIMGTPSNAPQRSSSISHLPNPGSAPGLSPDWTSGPALW